jgi:hypothetical protein
VERNAKVQWFSSLLRGKHALPAGLRYIGIGRFAEDGPTWPDGAWSVLCRFDVPPAEQGNPSTAHVSFLVDAAPHDRLAPGAKFELYEGPHAVASIEVLS